MKEKSNTTRMQHRKTGFSLVELLVVIAIIATLAGMIMAAVGGAKVKAKKMVAKTEMSNLKLGIVRYEGEYSVYPLDKALSNPNGDSTAFSGIPGLTYSGPAFDNSAIIDILRNVSFTDHLTLGNPKNPRKAVFFDAKVANEYKGGPKAPGIEKTTGILYDPWGNPYVITVDTDYNGVANDPVYNTDGLIREPVLIWSLGPDGKGNMDKASKDNKDNVLSWK